MRSPESSSYCNSNSSIWSKKRFSHQTNSRLLSSVVHWKMKSSCLKFELSKAILLKLQLVESLWISRIIPGICDTLSDAYSWEASSPLLSSAGCRSGFQEAAGWPEGSRGALGNDSSWELAVFTCLGSGSLFAASVTVGPKSLQCGLKADSGQICRALILLHRAQQCHTQPSCVTHTGIFLGLHSMY